MDLQYDFDIHWIIPQELTADPAIAKLMGELDFNMNARSNYVALFRDEATIEALRGADPVVLEYFQASGFGLVTYDSGAGPGRFPAKDEAAMADVTQRLSDNIEKFDIGGKNWNGFKMVGFLDHVVNLEAVEMAEPPVMATAAPSPDKGEGPISGGTPLDRVRRKHEAAARAAMASGDGMDDDTYGGADERPLPDPETGPVNKDRAARAARADRQFRIKSGMSLIFGAVILFTIAISKGQSLKGEQVLVAAPEPATAPEPTLDVTGNKALQLWNQVKDLSKADQSDL